METSTTAIAFVIVGQLRGFQSVAVQSSIARYAIGAVNEHSTTDLFVLLKLTAAELLRAAEIAQAAVRLGVVRFQLIGTRDHSSTIMYNNDRFSGASPVMEYSNATSNKEEDCPSFIQRAPGAMFHRFKAAWQDLAECYNMVRAHEASVRQGRRFDFVVKLRSDEELCSPLPPLSTWLHTTSVHQWQPMQRCESAGSRRGSCHATDDHIALVPRAASDRFFSAHLEAGASCRAASYSAFCARSAKSMEATRDIPAECLLARWLSMGGIEVDRGALLGVRSSCLWEDARRPRGNCSCAHAAASAAASATAASATAASATTASASADVAVAGIANGATGMTANAHNNSARRRSSAPRAEARAASRSGCAGNASFSAELVLSLGHYEATAAAPPYTLVATYGVEYGSVLNYCSKRRQPWRQYEWTLPNERVPSFGTDVDAFGKLPTAITAFAEADAANNPPLPCSLPRSPPPPWPPPTLHRAIRPFASVDYCGALRGAPSILFVGDSMQLQMFESLILLARTHEGESQPLGPLRSDQLGEIDCPPRSARWQCIAVRLCGGSWVGYIRNDHLVEIDSHGLQLDNNESGVTFHAPMHLPFLQHARTVDVLVLNRGIHFVEDAALTGQVEWLVQKIHGLRRTNPRLRVFWRTTLPGHVNCSRSSTLLGQRYVPPVGYGDPAARGGETGTRQFGYEHMERQNALVRRVLREWLPDGAVEFIDAAALSNRRADRHVLWGGSAIPDCLHYCAPGPVDDWSALFALQLQCRVS